MSDASDQRSGLSDSETLSENDSNCTEAQARKQLIMSEKGRRMANSLAEYLLLRYFFGPQGMKDRRRVNIVNNQFNNDMQFNLKTGIVTKATLKLSTKRFLEWVYRFYDQEYASLPKSMNTFKGSSKEYEKLMLAVLEDMRFMQRLPNFELSDKLAMLKLFKIRKLAPGKRITSHGEYIDSFHLILKGKIGIFYGDQKRIRSLTSS
jgi:hypothetical protein